MIRILHFLSDLDISSGASVVAMNYYRNINKEHVQFDFLYFEDTSTNCIDEIETLGGNVYRIQKPNFSKESIKENSLNQSNVNQPLRNCFINILSPVESNKRCQTNITSKEAWTNPNVSFNYSTVNFQTAGEQLKSEHGTSEEGQITEGTQLIQSMSQRGFTDEETNDLLNAIAKIM